MALEPGKAGHLSSLTTANGTHRTDTLHHLHDKLLPTGPTGFARVAGGKQIVTSCSASFSGGRPRLTIFSPSRTSARAKYSAVSSGASSGSTRLPPQTFLRAHVHA